MAKTTKNLSLCQSKAQLENLEYMMKNHVFGSMSELYRKALAFYCAHKKAQKTGAKEEANRTDGVPYHGDLPKYE